DAAVKPVEGKSLRSDERGKRSVLDICRSGNSSRTIDARQPHRNVRKSAEECVAAGNSGNYIQKAEINAAIDAEVIDAAVREGFRSGDGQVGSAARKPCRFEHDLVRIKKHDDRFRCGQRRSFKRK